MHQCITLDSTLIMEHFVASLRLGSVDHWTWSAWSVDRFIPWKLLELIMECFIRQPHNDWTESVLVTLNNECCGSPRVERKRGLLIDHPPQPAGRRFLDVAVNRRLIEPRCFSIIANNHRRIRKTIIRQSWQQSSRHTNHRENKQLYVRLLYLCKFLRISA